ncbi:glucomannan 4-beta-mannosyltransferase 1-like isoform X2 [Musa acuminata AAA Group]|uniref:glucomannan 4-beta-mannosyltransferase 1-like isoform X2 n=1 Tax=Musa acuminata AAA Group TaxID=214697 RepID=UPI0031CF9FFF
MRNPVLVEGAGDGAAVGERLLVLWRRIRTPMVVPLLWALMYACAFMSVMLFVERVYMAIVIVLVKLLRIKRYTKYKLDSMRQEMEAESSHPMVLVQIPMFNEKEVYRLSIGAACAMSWPSNKMIVQVLDDSTDPVIKEMVEYECQSWASKGVNVEYEFRNSRSGYKAGALREGLEKSYAKDCDFVAIFDADFQPDPDYLWRTIPFLLTNPELALVQARWKFVNADECLLTRLQEMSLDYHFSVEQEVGSSTYSFFGFNGTAGVWRMQALVDAGGWKDRTTVEDMDLAVRASLRGWKFVFVGDLAVKNELPSTFKAYRFQQHRWSCGPANLFRKMLKEILCCKFPAEGVRLEEVPCHLRLLLREEDCRPLCDLLLLLRDHPGVRPAPGRSSSQVHRRLHPLRHHRPQRHLHAQVLPPDHLLDPVRERHGDAPSQGDHNRASGGEPRLRVDRHRQAGERFQEQEQLQVAQEISMPHRGKNPPDGGPHGTLPLVLHHLRHHVRPRPLLRLLVRPIHGVLRRRLRLRWRVRFQLRRKGGDGRGLQIQFAEHPKCTELTYCSHCSHLLRHRKSNVGCRVCDTVSRVVPLTPLYICFKLYLNARKMQ